MSDHGRMLVFDRKIHGPRHRVSNHLLLHEIADKTDAKLPWELRRPQLIVIYSDIVELFEQIRNRVGVAIQVTSGHRIMANPVERRSSSKYRTHVKSIAIDMLCPEEIDPPFFRAVSERHVRYVNGGFGLYIKYPRLVHIDTLQDPPNRRWPVDWRARMHLR